MQGVLKIYLHYVINLDLGRMLIFPSLSLFISSLSIGFKVCQIIFSRDLSNAHWA